MEFDTILYERRGGIVYLTLNRPERANTINSQMGKDLRSAVDAVEQDPEARVVIITGAGNRFCGGADLRDVPSGPEVRWVIDHLEEMPQPFICAINGVAMGGGCEIALACDLRIMAASATIGLSEIRFGALPGGGGIARLPRVIGPARAKEMIFSGNPIDAQEAYRIGLANGVVPDEQLMDSATEMAETFVERARYAVATAKFLINQGTTMDLPTALAMERRVIATMASPEERAAARDRAVAGQSTYRRIFSTDAAAGASPASSAPGGDA